MKKFSLSCDFFLLGGINFFGSLLLLLLFSLIPMGIWEPLNAIWQFLFLLFFLGILFDVVPVFLTNLRKKHPDVTVVCESFGWIPYVYVVAFTTLAGLDIFGQFRLQFSPIGMWLTVVVPVLISLVVLYRETRKVVADMAMNEVVRKVVKSSVSVASAAPAKGKVKMVNVKKSVAATKGKTKVSAKAAKVKAVKVATVAKATKANKAAKAAVKPVAKKSVAKTKAKKK